MHFIPEALDDYVVAHSANETELLKALRSLSRSLVEHVI